MPATQIPQTTCDYRQGSVEFRLNVGVGQPTCSVGYVLRDADSANADRLQEPFDLSLLTSTERNNLANVLKKIAKIATAAKLNVADPATLVEDPNWVFSEP